MKINFRKVNFSDVDEILNLFYKVFEIKLSKKYYLSRYYNFKTINCFVVTIENKIVGHVGFIKNKINLSDNLSYYVFSRHTSMIAKKYRRLGMYRDLCNFSYNLLKQNNVLGVVTFPNKENLLAINPKYQNINLNNKILYFYKSKNKLNRSYNKKLNLFILYKLIKRQKNDYFFVKNINYYKKNYLNLSLNKFYYFSANNLFLIYNIKKYKNKSYVNILESPALNINSMILFKNFFEHFGNKYIINIWIDKILKNKKIIKDLNLKKTNDSFVINLIPFKKKLIKFIDNKNFSMGDTDVFHVIN